MHLCAHTSLLKLKKDIWGGERGGRGNHIWPNMAGKMCPNLVKCQDYSDLAGILITLNPPHPPGLVMFFDWCIKLLVLF